jgi:hypothetical protein
MTVRLALRKNDTRLAARGIQFWTNSIYSHCELVIDGMCYSSSAMDKGVRAKVIDLDPAKWDVIDLPWANAAQVLRYFQATRKHNYGWASMAASQVLNLNRELGDAPFCSQWCAAAMKLPNPVSYSPRTLGELCLYINGHAATYCPALA